MAAPRHGPTLQAAADGSFALTSYESNDGAPAGDYTLTVELRSLVKNGGDVTAGPNTLPAKYGRAETSPVTVQIAEQTNDLPEIHNQEMSRSVESHQPAERCFRIASYFFHNFLHHFHWEVSP